jgi:pimeloyl-ACP methyl ester carboxylesterase
MGDMISSVLGPDFDILAFDRRGTGATTPLALCFDSDSQLAVWNLQDVTSLNASDGSIPFARAHENVVGERCLSALGGNGKEDLNGTAEEWGLGRFMDTASVATDVLRIVEKLGQEKLQFAGFVGDSYFNPRYKLIHLANRALAPFLVNILLRCTQIKSVA